MCSCTLKVDINGDVRRLPNWPQCLGDSAELAAPSMQLIIEAVVKLHELTASEGHALAFSCKDEQGCFVVLDDGILPEMLVLASQNAGIFRLTASSQQQPGVRGQAFAEPLPGRETAEETPHAQRAMGSIQNLAGALAGRLNEVRGHASERASGLAEHWAEARVRVGSATATAAGRLAHAQEDIQAVGARAAETWTQACDAFRESHRGVQQVQEDILKRAFGTDHDTAADTDAAPSGGPVPSTAMKVATIAGGALGVAVACRVSPLRVSRLAAVGLATAVVAGATGHTNSSCTQNVPAQVHVTHPEESSPATAAPTEESRSVTGSDQ